MASKILVGIDGSEASQRAVNFAEQQAKAGSSQLVVAYVIEWSPYTFNTPEENEQRYKRREEEIALAQERFLNPLLEQLKNNNVDADGLIRHGQPAKTLNAIAQEEQVDQIIVGRQGQSGFKEMLFGSVAGNLVQTADVPVTFVP